MFGYTIVKKSKLEEIKCKTTLVTSEIICLKNENTLLEWRIDCLREAANRLPGWAKQRFWNHYNFYTKALPLLEAEKTTIKKLSKVSELSNIPFSTLKRYWYSYKATGEI